MPGVSASCRRVSDEGKIENRFLSGVTPKGLITFTNTVKNLADDITVIRDESGITEKLLAEIADYSACIGYDVIVCRDVLFPEKTASNRQAFNRYFV